MQKGDSARSSGDGVIHSAGIGGPDNLRPPHTVKQCWNEKDGVRAYMVDRVPAAQSLSFRPENREKCF